MARIRFFSTITVLLVLLFSNMAVAEITPPASTTTATVEEPRMVDKAAVEKEYSKTSASPARAVPYAVQAVAAPTAPAAIMSRDEIMSKEMYYSMDMRADFMEMMKYCDDPEKLKSFALEKMQKAVGEAQNFCDKMQEKTGKCQEETDHNCKNMFQVYHDPYTAEKERKRAEAYNKCPPDKEAIIQACTEGSGSYIEDQKATMHERCEINWKQYGERNYQECNRYQQDVKCNADDFVNQCLKSWNVKPEDFKPICLTSDDASSKKAACQGTVEEVKDGDCMKDLICKVNDPEAKCGTDYKPVCGSNGLTYTNYCFAGLAGVSYMYGTCASTRQVYKTATGSTGQVLDSYEDFVDDCKQQWSKQEKYCSEMQKSCKDRDSFIKDCIHQEEQNVDKMLTDIKYNCERDALINIKQMERECQRREEEIKLCLLRGADNCKRMEEEIQRCKEQYNEEKFKAMALEMAQKQCSLRPIAERMGQLKDVFQTIEENRAAVMEVAIAVDSSITKDQEENLKSLLEGMEQVFENEKVKVFQGHIKANEFKNVKGMEFVLDVKILSAVKEEGKAKIDEERIVDKVVERLLALQQQGQLSEELSFFLTDEAGDIMEAADEAEEIEIKEKQKGFFYKMFRTLGFMKKREAGEIKQLEESGKELITSIEKLSKLADEIQDPIYKGVLQEQVEELKKRKAEIDSLITDKQKKAKLI